MTIEMNLDYLFKNKMTANQFLVLQLILEKRDDRLKEVAEVIGVVEYSKIIKALVAMEFLLMFSEDEETAGYEVTQKALSTFKGKGHFEEFHMLYPVSVVRPDGKRESLRTAKKSCSTKYNRLAKRRDVHENIMKCLEFEIQERTKDGSLMYMKKMPNWLSSEAWKEWEEKMKVSSVLDDLVTDVYGTELV